jgi:hypothetical protein
MKKYREQGYYAVVHGKAGGILNHHVIDPGKAYVIRSAELYCMESWKKLYRAGWRCVKVTIEYEI